MASRSLRALSLLALASLLGCGGGTSSTQDAASDSAADAPATDAPAEATTDSAVDAAVEAAPPDADAPDALADAASLDAAPDALSDAAAEAAPEASTADAAPDVAADAGSAMPTVLATGLSGPGSVAVTDTDVLFAQCNGQIAAVSTSGGAVRTLASGQGCVCDVGTLGGQAYWVSPTNGTVLAAPLAGGPTVTLASGEGRPVALALTSTALLWGNQSSGLLRSMLLAGGAASTRASGQLNLQDIAADSTFLYWTVTPPNNVLQTFLAGGLPSPLVAGATSAPHSLVTGGGYVYWAADQGGGLWSIQRVAMTGGTPQVVLAPTMVGTSQPSVELAWSARGLLVALSGTPGMNDGRILRVPLAGGTPTTLASAQATPRGIAVNATVVVWSNGVGNTILSLPY